MNGETTVTSEPGRGSIFSVCIPVKITDPSVTWSTPLKQEPTATVASATDLSGIHILYVDDTALNLNVISKMVGRLGAKMDTVSDPYEGLKMAMEQQFDFLFLDHQMPGLDGIELLHRIRSSEGPNRNTPAVAFTGNALSGAEEMYKSEGFSAYLVKPIILENLVAILHGQS